MIRKSKRPVWAGDEKMKKAAFVLMVAVSLGACADSRPKPMLWQEIEGLWVRADNPKWHYQFGQGYATSWIYDFGAVIAPHWYKTDESGRDMVLEEINTGQAQYWRFSEIQGDTLCAVDDYSSGQSFSFDLKRVR